MSMPREVAMMDRDRQTATAQRRQRRTDAHLPLLWLAGLAILAPAAPAYAYIDTGTGSMLLQMLVAGVAGVAVILKTYWRRLKRLFSRTADPDAAVGATPPPGAGHDPAKAQGKETAS